MAAAFMDNSDEHVGVIICKLERDKMRLEVDLRQSQDTVKALRTSMHNQAVVLEEKDAYITAVEGSLQQLEAALESRDVTIDAMSAAADAADGAKQALARVSAENDELRGRAADALQREADALSLMVGAEAMIGELKQSVAATFATVQEQRVSKAVSALDCAESEARMTVEALALTDLLGTLTHGMSPATPADASDKQQRLWETDLMNIYVELAYRRSKHRTMRDRLHRAESRRDRAEQLCMAVQGTLDELLVNAGKDHATRTRLAAQIEARLDEVESTMLLSQQQQQRPFRHHVGVQAVPAPVQCTLRNDACVETDPEPAPSMDDAMAQTDTSGSDGVVPLASGDAHEVPLHPQPPRCAGECDQRVASLQATIDRLQDQLEAERKVSQRVGALVVRHQTELERSHDAARRRDAEWEAERSALEERNATLSEQYRELELRCAVAVEGTMDLQGNVTRLQQELSRRAERTKALAVDMDYHRRESSRRARDTAVAASEALLAAEGRSRMSMEAAFYSNCCAIYDQVLPFFFYQRQDEYHRHTHTPPTDDIPCTAQVEVVSRVPVCMEDEAAVTDFERSAARLRQIESRLATEVSPIVQRRLIDEMSRLHESMVGMAQSPLSPLKSPHRVIPTTRALF